MYSYPQSVATVLAAAVTSPAVPDASLVGSFPSAQTVSATCYVCHGTHLLGQCGAKSFYFGGLLFLSVIISETTATRIMYVRKATEHIGRT